eukprot:3546490-Amphidinium_carterae.1
MTQCDRRCSQYDQIRIPFSKCGLGHNYIIRLMNVTLGPHIIAYQGARARNSCKQSQRDDHSLLFSISEYNCRHIAGYMVCWRSAAKRHIANRKAIACSQQRHQRGRAVSRTLSAEQSATEPNICEMRVRLIFEHDRAICALCCELFVRE